MKRLARLLAGGLGVGRTPVAPGTAASAVATLAGGALLGRSRWWLAAGAAAAGLGGLWAVRRGCVEGDPGWVVIDEVAGQWTALLGLSRPAPLGLAAGFALFRLLDVAKPGPVGWADRRSGPVGVMADDVIAGAMVAGVLWAVRRRWPWLL